MNISYNQRYVSTEEKIQKALFSLLRIKRYNNITIKEICYEAGINRSSFYAHYQDINDLMIKIENFLSKEIVKIFDMQVAWNEGVFVKLFEFLKNNKDFYKCYLETNEQTFMETNDFMNFIHLIKKHSRDFDFNENEKIYHMAFFAGGLKALAKSWIKKGCVETPENMAKILTNEYKINSKYLIG